MRWSMPLAASTSFHLHDHAERFHDLGYHVVRQTYRSDAMSLRPGEVVFTDKDHFVLQFPHVKGSYAITRFQAEVVDEAGASVPLDEVYNHHWLVFNSQGNRGVCGGFLTYIFGVGQESRRTPVAFPDGTGYLAQGDWRWTANIHLLRTQGLRADYGESQAVKDCIECSYHVGKGCRPHETGTFACCQDHSFCPVDGSVGGRKNYYLSYTMEYTQDVGAIEPVRIFVLDGSNCAIEYNIEANDANPYQVTQHSWIAPSSGDIAFAQGHVHNAGVNITLLVNDEVACVSIPRYGTEPKTPGNEKGFIVEFSTCRTKFVIKAGDRIGVRAVYYVGHNDTTGSGVPGGSHGGVMALFYLGAVESTLRDAGGEVVKNPWQLEWQPAHAVLV